MALTLKMLKEMPVEAFPGEIPLENPTRTIMMLIRMMTTETIMIHWDYSCKKHVLGPVPHRYWKVQADNGYDAEGNALASLLVCEGVKEVGRKAENVATFLRM